MKQKPPEKTKKRCVSTDSGHTQMHSCRPARSHALIHDRLRPRALIQHTWYVQKKHNQNIKNKTQNKHQNQNQNKTKPKTKTKTNQKNTRYVRRTRHHTHALTQACEQHTPCQDVKVNEQITLKQKKNSQIIPKMEQKKIRISVKQLLTINVNCGKGK